MGLLGAAAVLTYAVDRAGHPGRAVRVFSSTTTTTTTAAAAGLRVLAYNIAHGRGAGDDNFTGERPKARRRRLDALAKTIAGYDVVVLNEVDFDSVWSHGVNQAEHLGRAAGYPHRAEQRNVDFGIPGLELRFGNAILSRRPLSGCERVALPPRSELEAWLVGHKQGVVCEIDGVRVMAVHLEHRDEDTRIAGVEYVLEEVVDERPMILAGDFNSTLPGWPGAQLGATGRTALGVALSSGRFAPAATAAVARRNTFPSTAPSRVIDWVLGPAEGRVRGLRVVGATLSDHLGVEAVVELSAR